VAFNSAYESFGEAQGAIISSTKPMVKHYQLVVKDCEFYSFNETTMPVSKQTKAHLPTVLYLRTVCSGI
jgi:poly(beta-D-mannuronate) lyase